MQNTEPGIAFLLRKDAFLSCRAAKPVQRTTSGLVEICGVGRSGVLGFPFMRNNSCIELCTAVSAEGLRSGSFPMKEPDSLCGLCPKLGKDGSPKMARRGSNFQLDSYVPSQTSCSRIVSGVETLPGQASKIEGGGGNRWWYWVVLYAVIARCRKAVCRRTSQEIIGNKFGNQ